MSIPLPPVTVEQQECAGSSPQSSFFLPFQDDSLANSASPEPVAASKEQVPSNHTASPQYTPFNVECSARSVINDHSLVRELDVMTLSPPPEGPAGGTRSTPKRPPARPGEAPPQARSCLVVSPAVNNSSNKVVSRHDISTRTRGQTTRVVQDSLSSILEEALALLRHRDRLEIFYYPVDQNAVPGYSKTISHPMDFSTMATKIRDCVYTSFSDFQRDVDLIFSNCRRFNPNNTIFYKQAVAISQWWNKAQSGLRERADALQQRSRMSSSAANESARPEAEAASVPAADGSSPLTSAAVVPHREVSVQPKVRRHRLPYIKSRFKSASLTNGWGSVGEILQHHGERGVLNRLAKGLLYKGDTCHGIACHLVERHKRQLVTAHLLQTPPASGKRKQASDGKTMESSCSPLDTCNRAIDAGSYSGLMSTITDFLGRDIAHIVAPELPSLQHFLFPAVQLESSAADSRNAFPLVANPSAFKESASAVDAGLKHEASSSEPFDCRSAYNTQCYASLSSSSSCYNVSSAPSAAARLETEQQFDENPPHQALSAYSKLWNPLTPPPRYSSDVPFTSFQHNMWMAPPKYSGTSSQPYYALPSYAAPSVSAVLPAANASASTPWEVNRNDRSAESQYNNSTPRAPFSANLSNAAEPNSLSQELHFENQLPHNELPSSVLPSSAQGLSLASKNSNFTETLNSRCPVAHPMLRRDGQPLQQYNACPVVVRSAVAYPNALLHSQNNNSTVTTPIVSPINTAVPHAVSGGWRPYPASRPT